MKSFVVTLETQNDLRRLAFGFMAKKSGTKNDSCDTFTDLK